MSTQHIDLDAPEHKAPVEIERDQYGRYVIPDPETGERRSWVRASTVSRGLADTTALDKYLKRNLVYGIGQREDLFAMAASVASVEEKGTLDQIIDAAYEVSASSSGANLGTAIHRFAERIDDGELFDVPTKWKKDVDAYVETMRSHGIRIEGLFTERVVLNTHIDVAGTCDRFLGRDDWPLPRVGDLKTGKHVVQKMDEIAGQLAIYANATHWYDPLSKTLHEMPQVDRALGIVMHVPVGKGICTLYEVDIAAGWEAVQHEIAIRDWRKRKDLCVPLSSWEPKAKPCTCGNPSAGGVQHNSEGACFIEQPAEDLLLQQRVQWVTTRAKAIVDAGHGKDLVEVWAQACADIPTFRKGGPRTNEQVDRVAGACNVVETAHRLPFEDNGDPAKAKPTNNTIKELLG